MAVFLGDQPTDANNVLVLTAQEAMAACILNILNANWEGVVDDLRVIGILPPVASVWTNDAGERIKFEAGTVGQWVDLSDAEFKVQPPTC